MKLSRLMICLSLSVGNLCAKTLFAQQESLSLNGVNKDSVPAALPDSSISAGTTLKDAEVVLKENLALTPIVDSVHATAKTPIVSKPISLRAILIPTAMIGYGAFALSNKELKEVNLTLRKEFWENRNNGQGKLLPIDNFSLVAPAVAVYALNIAGIKGKNNFVDRSLIYGMSNLIGTGIVSSVKRMADVIRPDSSNTLSFPSGHTAKAFIAAEFMRQEYKDLSPWYGVAAYTVAAGTGFLRMYNNKHWFNDVVAGAGVGILSTRLSYWLYPKIKNVFVKDKSKDKTSGTLIMPTYQNGAFGVGMVHSF